MKVSKNVSCAEKGIDRVSLEKEQIKLRQIVNFVEEEKGNVRLQRRLVRLSMRPLHAELAAGCQGRNYKLKSEERKICNISLIFIDIRHNIGCEYNYTLNG